MNKIEDSISENGSEQNYENANLVNTSIASQPSKEFNKMISNSKEYFTKLAYKLAELTTNILSTSKGRNKICSLIQYQAKLIYTTTTNSNIPEVQEMLMYFSVT